MSQTKFVFTYQQKFPDLPDRRMCSPIFVTVNELGVSNIKIQNINPVNFFWFVLRNLAVDCNVLIFRQCKSYFSLLIFVIF